ncbi:alpha-hydroxy-acid oxidizing protein [SAR202 cluster bacterium AD-804-J14_MRT_500m]|nr:alpha-hydroxy-acid oxidizing protein [SAR202 cluster bacterium AD-804-J14_MRT_500m]
MTNDPINLFEFEPLAKASLSKAEYDFIAGGATDEITLRRTRAAFDSIMLRPRMLTDVGQRDLKTTVQGNTISLPVLMDPAGDHARAHPDAELATVRAAANAGTVMALSSGSTYTLEQVAETASGPLWFQSYFFRDRELTLEFANRAEEAGYSALVVTVDAKVQPKRERNIRNRYSGRPSVNYSHLNLGPQTWTFGADAPTALNDIRDPAATWADLEWLSSSTKLPLIIKGIMTGEDGLLCANYGAKGLIVSNHGARNLDSTFATIEVLPEIADAVDQRLEIYLDGGIRRGTDIFKAIALGARAVLIGRPIFWGLAVGGEAGVTKVLNILRDELDSTMAFCGTPDTDSINRSYIGMSSPLLSALAPERLLENPTSQPKDI